MVTTEPSTRRALGRGLAALIPVAPDASSDGIRTLPIEKVRPDPKQPRKHFDDDSLDDLAASIREQGILQPIIVKRHEDHYQIITGERRWRATSRAGLQQIPALVRECTDEQALKVALVENIQREDLDPLEEAGAFSRLIRDHNLTQEQVGQAVGRSRSAITNSLRLLKLPQPVLDLLAEGKLTAGHARALMTLKGEEDILRLANEVVERGTSVRDTEAKARMFLRARKKTTKIPEEKKGIADASLEERLMRSLQTKVRLHHRNGKGRVEIFFHSYEHLDTILAKLDP